MLLAALISNSVTATPCLRALSPREAAPRREGKKRGSARRTPRPPPRAPRAFPSCSATLALIQRPSSSRSRPTRQLPPSPLQPRHYVHGGITAHSAHNGEHILMYDTRSRSRTQTLTHTQARAPRAAPCVSCVASCMPAAPLETGRRGASERDGGRCALGYAMPLSPRPRCRPGRSPIFVLAVLITADCRQVPPPPLPPRYAIRALQVVAVLNSGASTRLMRQLFCHIAARRARDTYLRHDCPYRGCPAAGNGKGNAAH